MKWIRGIDEYLRCVPTHKFIILMVLLSYIVVVPLIPLAILFDIDDMGGADAIRDSLPIMEFVLVVIIAPFLETLLFQTTIFYVLNKFIFLKSRSLIVIMLSAVAFGMGHNYSTLYVMFGFLVGLVLAYAYHVYLEKSESSYKVVTIIHSIRNLLAFVLGFVVCN